MKIIYELRTSEFHGFEALSQHAALPKAIAARKAYNRVHCGGEERCACGGALIVRADGQPLTDAEHDMINAA